MLDAWREKSWFRLSVLLAAAAWLEFLIAPIAASLHGIHNPGLWALVAGWPLFYGLVVGICYEIHKIADRGRVMEQMPALWLRWMDWLLRGWPWRPFMEACYRAMPPVFMIVMPMFGNLFGILLLVFAIRGEINPG